MSDCVVYARISADLGGQALGVGRQVEDCTAKATALGWHVAQTFIDNDVSASKAVPRPQYAAMLAAIETDSVKAIVVYDLDRLTRKPAELETFIDLTAAHGVALANVSGDVDLTTANGRMVARIKGAVARQEADRIAERTKRQKQQRVQQGKPLGQRFRTFGYERDWSVNPDEASVVVEVFERVASGESHNAITRDLVNRGIRTASGGVWTPLQTSRMVKTPKYAGFQTFKGAVVGKSSVIPALVDEAIYEACQKPVKAATSNFRKYLLSGILICDSCKVPMSGTRVLNNGQQTVRYRCDTRSGGCGGVSIKGAWIDGFVNRYMSAAVMWAAEKRAKNPPKTTNRDDEINAIDERIGILQAALGNPDVAIEDTMAALTSARTRRKALVKEASANVVEAMTHQRAIADYDNLNDEDKRAEIRKVFRFIFIRPGRRVRYFDESRVYAFTTLHDGPVAGAALNIVDYRDRLGEGTRVVEGRPFNPDIGF